MANATLNSSPHSATSFKFGVKNVAKFGSKFDQNVMGDVEYIVCHVLERVAVAPRRMHHISAVFEPFEIVKLANNPLRIARGQ